MTDDVVDNEPNRRDPATHWRDPRRRIAKVAYPSKRVAKAKAKQIFGNTSEKLFPYRCGSPDGCNGWHLSGSPRRSID